MAQTTQQPTPGDNVLAASKPAGAKRRWRSSAPKPEIPADKPIPTRGIRGLEYKANKLFGEGHIVPPLGKKERVEHEQREAERIERERIEQKVQAERERIEQETRQLIKRLRFLAALGIQPVLSFCNIKSASKTTVALYVASVISEFTRKNVLLLPATQNTATSTAALMAGIGEGNIITVEEYSREIKNFGAYRALSQRVPRTPFGLGLISEDPNDATDVTDLYAAKEFEEIVGTTLPNVDVLVLDHGNDNIRRGGIPLAAARSSHVLIFTYMVDSPVTRDSLARTLAGYYTDLEQPLEIDNDDPTGRSIATRDKVRRSIVVASKADDAVDVDFAARTASVPDWNGVGLSVPADDYIGKLDENGQVSTCDLDKIMPRTLLAFLRIAVTAFELTAELQGIAVPEQPTTPTTAGG